MTYPQTGRTVPSRYPDRATYDKDVAHALLDEAFVCQAAFVVDGAPRVLPTLFARIGDRLYLHGSTASTPLLAARRGDGIPICVTVTQLDGLVLARSQFNHSANYRSLVAHGVATLVADEPEKRAAMTALVEKTGPGRSAHSRPPTPAELAKTAVLVMDLDEVSVKRRTGGVGDDPEDMDLPHWAGVVPMRVSSGYAVADTGVTVPTPDYLPSRPAWFEAPALRGEHVVLEPMRREDAAELFAALDDDEVHRHIPTPRPRTETEMVAVIEAALALVDDGLRVPWTARDAITGEVVGTTSYHDIKIGNETLAIGATQFARARWRTAINTESKLLLLTRAFETLGAGRVEWHTDIRNERSQAAIARLGATREGVLRRQKRRADGTWRDTVLYSMTVDEWPSVRNRLVTRLSQASH